MCRYDSVCEGEPHSKAQTVKQFLGWWQQADNYDWLSAYLRDRRMARFTQLLMAAITLALGTIPPLMLLSPHGPTSTLNRLVSATVGLSCLVMTVMWLRRWPTRGQSAAFSIVATVCISAACLNFPAPNGGLLACAAFASLAGYVAFFHSWRYLFFTLVCAAAVALTCTVRLAAQTDVVYAVGNLAIIMVAVLAIPLSAQVLLHVLGSDAAKSHVDSLTGLTNRRGFYRLTRELMGRSATTVSVLMIDLDNFKRINDTEGHAGGDLALIEVANILRATVPAHAVVARVGGEEFLIAQDVAADAMWAPAQEIQERILSTRWGLTASIGVASVTAPRDGTDVRPLIEEMIAAADSAMYVAKRSGGNQTRYAAA